MYSSYLSFSTLSSGTLRIAAFPGFAPFSWREGGEARGRDIVFLSRFALLHGLRPVVEFRGFDRLWELPGREEADIAASGISMRADCGERGVAWSRPYSEVRRTLLIRRADVETIRNIGDVPRMSVVSQSAADRHARDFLSKGAELTFITTLEEGIEDLVLGNTDAVGTGSVSAHFHIARHPGLAAVDVHGELPPELISFVARTPVLAALDDFIAHHRAWY
jgi:ABC-type amino acid transport substrate-binding protein